MNQYQKRFDLIMSDPMNDLIPRDQFRIDDDVITLHNGVKVYDRSYFGEFSEILKLNKGVHEPSEEYVFGKIIEQYRGKSPVMVELGSYWAMYSMWLKKIAPDAKTICYDVDRECLETGVAHYELNGMTGEFHHERIGSRGIPYDGWINIVHCDIQGDEAVLLQAEKNCLYWEFFDYLFISTHSNVLHNVCRSILLENEYNILADVDLDQTYCEDGILVACSNIVEPIYFDLPKRNS